ncbi:hypothetical protein OIU77_018462 [Salix suchowensis]|uniref:Uncharacterized protein n=1 Tax=Salix suchowensis TaxID=1278906 RepID=A0ABQ9CGK1_9ROSI|nr:hypothetical protein OIU77_018462 [Salix suchowensis]
MKEIMVVRGGKKGKAGSVKRQDRDRGRQMSFSQSQSSFCPRFALLYLLMRGRQSFCRPADGEGIGFLLASNCCSVP